jgi:hypothetical protein
MYRVCSKHFHDRCFTKGIGQTPRLKRDALPTLNLPERQTTSEIIDHSYSVMSNTPTAIIGTTLPLESVSSKPSTSQIIDHSYPVISNTPTGDLLLIVIYVSLLIK